MSNCVKCGGVLGRDDYADRHYDARECVEILYERLAEAEATAQWLLYYAPDKPCREIREFVNQHPWLRIKQDGNGELNCSKSSKS